jgi:hypothetical protein
MPLKVLGADRGAGALTGGRIGVALTGVEVATELRLLQLTIDATARRKPERASAWVVMAVAPAERRLAY